MTGLFILTPFIPESQSLLNNVFRPTTIRTRANANLIFDVMATTGSVSPGIIPLSSEQPGFNTQRYWRLPINSEIILAILCNHVSCLPKRSTGPSAELRLARSIYVHLYTNGGGGCGGGDDNGNAAGTSKARKEGEPEKKRPRRGAKEDLDLGFLIKGVERSSDEVSSCERPHYGVHPKEWDVATLFLPLADDKSQHSETYSGPSNHESDCEEGDHSEWSFGPSFSSGMIISRARQLMNL